MFVYLPYRGVIAAIYLVVAVLAGAAMQYSIAEIDSDIANVARERGHGLFRLIELTREWNSRHGGVYVPVTGLTQPNPYLDQSDRDITDNFGRTLTLVNPAFMTRQIGEIAAENEGVHFHITSLNPIRGANRADAWETETLKLFEQAGLRERLAFLPDGGEISGPVHRYMAPLQVYQSCLKCHAFQGYKVGDVRGGISVTMPAGKLVAITDERRRQVIIVYAAFALVVAGLCHVAAWHTRRHLLTLAETNRSQEIVIAERMHDLSEAEREQRIAAAVFANAAEAIIVTDKENRILRVNPAFTTITGYSPADSIGRDPALLKSGRHDAAFFAEMWHHLDAVGCWQGEIWNRRKNGEVFAALLSIATLPDENGGGRHVATLIDITERKQAEEIVLRRANYDTLTSLPNRSLFDDRLASALALAHRHKKRFALLYIDLDHFKDINDGHGHATGDAVLVEAGRRMKACLRDSDTVARFGGDEFAVILSELPDVARVEDVARRLIGTMKTPFTLPEGTSVHCAASVGIAVYPEHGSDDLLLKRSADRALYAAKAAGRNTFRMAETTE